jgi:hypothetical protein
MNDTNDLDGTCLPGIHHNERVEIPEAVSSTKQFLVMMANARGTAKRVESIVQTLP